MANQIKKSIRYDNDWYPDEELIGVFRSSINFFEYSRPEYFFIKSEDVPFSYYHFDERKLSEISDDSFIIGVLYRWGDVQFMVTGKTEGNEDTSEGLLREIKEEVDNNIVMISDTVLRLNNTKIILEKVDMKKRITMIQDTSRELLGIPVFTPKFFCEVCDKKFVSKQLLQTHEVEKNHKIKVYKKVGCYLILETKKDVYNFLRSLTKVKPSGDSLAAVVVMKAKLVKDRIKELSGYGGGRGNSPSRIRSIKSSSCRDCKLYLSKLLVKDLKKIAKQFDCKNSSTMVKSELIQFILSHHKK